jgi:lipopolysaccharide/colanic/teichoic acid biosynthesis glycosyltransferase
MSLVGPRPPLPHEVQVYTRHQLRRLGARPGLTGLWQVSGRSTLPFDEMVALDIQYIEEWTLVRDMVILVKTLPAVVSTRGAY